MLKDYYRLAKPGIIYGNVFTTIAAFLFASQWHFKGPWLFTATVFGISLIIGSACVFNNYLDRDLDAQMERTRNRVLVTGVIRAHHALIYGAVLGVFGTVILFLFVNILTTAIALIGFIFYVVLYGVAKRRSHWGAVIGSIPGAIPIVVGYTAVMNHLDPTAWILFLVLVAWQMPHFYAIALYRLDEYRAAKIPVLPAVKGWETTKIHIVLYILLYIVATGLLWVFGYAGYVYLFLVEGSGLAWLWKAFSGSDAVWARKLFLFSLIVLVVFCVAIAITPLLVP